MTRQLSTLSWLRSLNNLDLDFIRIDKVEAGNTKSARGNLLNGRAPTVTIWIRSETINVLSSFTGVGLPSESVHRNG